MTRGPHLCWVDLPRDDEGGRVRAEITRKENRKKEKERKNERESKKESKKELEGD